MIRSFTITRGSAPQVYHVGESESFHTVRLRAYKWNGECNCPTFTDCCLPLLKLEKNPVKRWRCDHILAARDWVMEYELPLLVERSAIVPFPNETTRVAVGV